MSFKVLINTKFILIDEDIYRFNKKINESTLIKENKDLK